MSTLWEALLAARNGRFRCWTGDGFTEAGWAEVVTGAREMAAGLRTLGVRPGVRVGTILTNTPLAVRGTLAIWLAGGTVASLPVPARGMGADEYAEQIAGLCDLAGTPILLTDARVLRALPERLRSRGTAWESIPARSPVAEEPPGPDEPAFIQFSSGSTSMPKGSVLTPRAIAAQLDIILDMTDAVPGAEVVGSWLPLSHDMGMFGCLLFPWAFDMSLVLSTPERFAFGGRSWFGDLSAFGATMTAGTNTALRLAARAQRGRLGKPLNLRTVIIGAERVERGSMLAAVDAFRDSGLSPANLMPAYGMAEATLAVSAAAPYEEPRFLAVDGIALADGRAVPADPDSPAATWLIGCGKPCRGVEVTSADPDVVDEFVVRSPSLATGYFGEPERTRNHFTPDGLRTGDLGLVHDGELFPVGRLDDVISVGGRNVNTREIELAVDALEAVRTGCSVIVNAGRLVLVTELRGHNADLGTIARAAGRAAMAKAGIALDECVFVERGSVPKTPSGKIQRYRTRQLMLTDRLPAIATVSVDGTS